jgi:hypothetical protein
VPLDANEIAPQLWQGSAPPTGPTVRRSGFDVLVLCAQEYQPPPPDFPGVRVIHAPMDDRAWIPEMEAHKAAQAAAAHIRAGRRVLVTCYKGWNRSGLVSALTLWYLTGLHGSHLVRRVRARRPVPENRANRHFAAYAAGLPPLRLDGRGGRAQRLPL